MSRAVGLHSMVCRFVTTLFFLFDSALKISAEVLRDPFSGDGLEPEPRSYSLMRREAFAENQPVDGWPADQAVQASYEADSPKGHTAWDRISLFARGNGAVVESNLRGRFVERGGAEVPGVVGMTSIPEKQVLMEVPKSLWIHLDNFWQIKPVDLTKLTPCANKLDTTLDLLKLAVAIAIEIKKGNSSWWDPYLRALPTLQEYIDFHPHFAGPEIFNDFGTLPIMNLVKHLQEYDHTLRTCFEEWQRQRSLVGGPRELPLISWWPYMALSMAHARTRRHAVELPSETALVDLLGFENATVEAARAATVKSSALIPGLDMLNPATNQAVNTEWVPGPSSLKLVSTRGVAAGTEMLDAYCNKCDNARLVLLWGVWLDNNPVKLEVAPGASAFCNQLHKQATLGEPPVGLREMVTSAFGMSSAKGNDEIFRDLVREGLHRRSGDLRCTPAKEKSQHRLRCLLARLALEHCAEVWASENDSLDLLEIGVRTEDDLPFASLRGDLAAEAVLASARRDVHAQLLPRA